MKGGWNMAAFNNYWRRHHKPGVTPGLMTAHELAGWLKASLDAKQFVFRLGFARKVLVARDGLLASEAAAALELLGVPLLFTPKPIT
jgi:hypothetical protein